MQSLQGIKTGLSSRLRNYRPNKPSGRQPLGNLITREAVVTSFPMVVVINIGLLDFLKGIGAFTQAEFREELNHGMRILAVYAFEEMSLASHLPARRQ